MSVIVILIGCSLLLAVGFLTAFIWAVRSGQFDDHYTPSVRMLFDGDQPGPSQKAAKGSASGTGIAPTGEQPPV